MTPSLTDTYDVLIVDPDPVSRLRIKDATTSVRHFGRVTMLPTLSDAHRRLTGEDRWDVVFISHSYPQSEVAIFISAGKATQQGANAAYMLVLENGAHDTEAAAQSLLCGADGFLREPYSLEVLDQVPALAARVKCEKGLNWEEEKFRMLLEEAMGQLNLICQLHSSGYEAELSRKMLGETTAVLKTLGENELKLYHAVAVEAFDKASISTDLFEGCLYRGASQRVRKRIEAKLLGQITRKKTFTG